ncbi:MAG TPA: hypothetical protein VFY26_16400 [Anaerolineales bacterium]|nr:hypothetical protein [Anaerolineales bacterium]
MANSRENPYVGPHAFQPEDEKKFAGRDRDITALYRLLIAERIVLLFSPSGAGKSSLVNAGLLPRMIEKGFKILPTVRVNLPLPDELSKEDGNNRYVMSMLQTMGDARTNIPKKELAQLTIDEYLRRRLCPDNPYRKDDEEIVEPKSFLIFDQFEEILTIDPNDDVGKREFFEQLGVALEESRRWALFVVREDYVAALDPYLRYLPTRLANTYRLDLLDYESAIEAICKPAGLMGVSYTSDAVEHLVKELRSVRVQRPDGTWEPKPQLGRYVEPVQLQVVCFRLWDRIDEDDTITKDEVTKLGSVDESLAGFYAEKVAETAGKTGTPEKEIRTWFDTKLITPANIRSQVMWEAGSSGGLDNDSISALEKTHLIRGESRRGIKWLELAHDRLIKPVRDNNSEWFEKNLSALQRHAMLWEAEKEPERLLLRDSELAQAEEWAAGKTLSGTEQRFLDNCIGLRKRLHAEASQREAEALAATNQKLRTSNRRVKIFSGFAIAIALYALLASLFAGVQRSLAEERRVAAESALADAEKQKQIAENLRDQAREEAGRASQEAARSLSLNLALSGSALVDENPPLAALLSIESLRINYQSQAEQNLRDLLGVKHPYLLGGHAYGISLTAFSPDEEWLVTIDGLADLNSAIGNSVRIWNTEGGDPSDVYTVAKYLGRRQWTAAVVSPDSRWLVLGDDQGSIMIYEFTTGDGVYGEFLLSSGQQPEQASVELVGITALSFGQHGGRDWLAVGQSDGTVALIDFSEENLAPLFSEGTPPEIISLGHGRLKINTLVFSPDGRWLAGGSDDFQVRFWDVENPQSTPISHLQAGEVRALVYSDEYAVGYGNSNILYFYDVRTPSENPETFTLNTVFPITALALDPANPDRLILGQSDGTIQFYEVDTFTTWEPFSASEDQITYLAFDRDGRWLVSASKDRNVRVWKINRSSANGVAGQSTILKIFNQEITSVHFSPRTNWLVAGSADRSIALWDLRAGFDPIEPARLAGENTTVYNPSFSPDGTWLAAVETEGETAVLNVWDTDAFASGNRTPALALDSRYTYAFNPNGKDLAAILWEEEGSSLEVVDLQNPGETGQRVYEGLADIAYLAHTPQGGSHLVAYDSNQKIYFWNTSDYGEPVIHSLESAPSDFKFSSTGRWLAAVVRYTTGGLIYLFDLQDPAAKPLVYESPDGGIYDFAFSPDERWFGVGTMPGETSDGNIYLWDLSQQAPQAVGSSAVHTGYVNTLAFDPASGFVATGDDAGVVRVWDLTGGIISEPVSESIAHTDWVVRVMFSPDGKWLASNAADGSINLWEWQAMEEGYYALSGHEGYVTILQFSPTSRWLASGSVDRTIRLWDLSNPYGTPIVLKGSSDEITTLAFSPDEQYLLSNTYTADARLWHLHVDDLKVLTCGLARRNLTENEWVQYVGVSLPYQSTCADLPDVPEPSPLPEEEKPSLAPTPVPQPAPGEDGPACSISSDVGVNLTFTNNSDSIVDVYWIDYNCEKQLYGTLEPGGSYQQGTYATHPWVFVDAETGDTLKTIVAGATDEEVTIP